MDDSGQVLAHTLLLTEISNCYSRELCVERIRNSGAVLIGKTNTSEFGLATHNMNRLGGPCVNPYRTTRTSGGSSGGAAAACAAGLGPLHHGTDGCGSIRIPAAYCGVVGLKPTGRSVPRYKRGPGISQFEADGALTRSVEDAALGLAAMCKGGIDRRDPAPLWDQTDLSDFRSFMNADSLHGLKLSAPQMLASDEIRNGIAASVEALQQAGVVVSDEMPELPEPSDTLRVVTLVGAVCDFGDLVREHAHDMCEYTRINLERGSSIKGSEVAKAYAEIDIIVRKMDHFFKNYNVLVLPTTSTTAPPNLLRVEKEGVASVSPWCLSTIYVALANITQAPAISLPTGFDRDGLPTSVQLMTRPGDEATLFRCASVVEKAVRANRFPPPPVM